MKHTEQYALAKKNQKKRLDLQGYLEARGGRVPSESSPIDESLSINTAAKNYIIAQTLQSEQGGVTGRSVDRASNIYIDGGATIKR